FLKFAQESYTLTFESYKAGVVSFVDLLASQTQISTARARRIEAITNWVRSLSRLSYAVGILMVYDDGPSLKPDIEEIQKE
ncbi:MAG: TolC family protein, partial [Parachlamydiaceae bacterium]